jgi:hypothetical protein
VASAAPPVAYTPNAANTANAPNAPNAAKAANAPNAANAATVSLEDGGAPDNDSTVVLPLAGVAWTGGPKKKNHPGGKSR